MASVYPSCIVCHLNFVSTDESLTYDGCKHRIHLRCLQHNITTLAVANCVECIPLLAVAGRAGVYPMDIGCDANLKRIINMSPVTDVQALRSSFVVSTHQPIQQTDVFADFTALGKHTGMSSSRSSRMESEDGRSAHTALMIADCNHTLQELGVRMTDVLACRMSFSAWIKTGRTLGDLVALGIDCNTLISKMNFGKEWPTTDYQDILALHMTFSDLVHCGFSGNIEAAITTRIPLSVYKLLNVTLQDLSAVFRIKKSAWYYMNHIPLADLVDHMGLTSAMFMEIEADSKFIQTMKWSVKDIEQKLRVGSIQEL